MPTLKEIYEQQANYVSNSGYSVHVASINGTVDIHHAISDRCIFLQGDEAACFISEARQIYNELETVTMSTVYLALAMPYIDNL